MGRKEQCPSNTGRAQAATTDLSTLHDGNTVENRTGRWAVRGDKVMQQWVVDPRGSDLKLDARSITALINAIGNHDRTALASAMLEVVGEFISVCHCTIFAYETGRNPRLISGASCVGDHWNTFKPASLYTRNLFRKDGIQPFISRASGVLRNSGTVVIRQGADDITDAEYRAACYDSLGIVDRLTALARVGKEQWIATNVYRDKRHGPFTFQQIELFRSMAPLLVGCATRHYASDIDGESSYRGTVTDTIVDLCPRLTAREREVLFRILDGVTTERIAEDLQIRPTTVITYRTRAYEKLGVSSRRELFATVLRNRTPTNQAYDPTSWETGAAVAH